MAISEASRFRDLFLDPQQLPGTFTGDFALGALNVRFREGKLGMAKTSEEIG